MIENKLAVRILEEHHPLGAGCAFAFAFALALDNRIHGVMTFGRPVTNSAAKCFGLRQCDTLELRKMWCDDVLPKNSESQALSVSARLIRKQYPAVHVLLTYCEGDERASAYRGAGWTPLMAHTYIGEYLINGKWYTARDFGRYFKRQDATDTKRVSRRKWAIGLTDKGRQAVAMAHSKIPSRPETGTGSEIIRGEESTQANSRDGSTSQQAAAVSS